MNPLIEVIRQKYGDACQLCPPLEKSDYARAKEMLPAAVFEMLQISNGIMEMMTHPNANGGEPFPIGYILYSFEDMQSETQYFSEQYGDEGIVIAGNGAGGFFVCKPDKSVWLYEYIGEDGERFADSLETFFAKGW